MRRSSGCRGMAARSWPKTSTLVVLCLFEGGCNSAIVLTKDRERRLSSIGSSLLVQLYRNSYTKIQMPIKILLGRHILMYGRDTYRTRVQTTTVPALNAGSAVTVLLLRLYTGCTAVTYLYNTFSGIER